jgi:hypothetical protein
MPRIKDPSDGKVSWDIHCRKSTIISQNIISEEITKDRKQKLLVEKFKEDKNEEQE